MAICGNNSFILRADYINRDDMSLKVLLLSSLVGFISFPVFSQSETQPIEKITVSASKHKTKLVDINSNLSILDGQSVSLINPQHINQSLNRVAGSWVSRGNGQEHLTAIRSPVLTGAGGCGAFFIAQDGISLRAPGFCNANQLFDVNSEQVGGIEVIRGPASTLYGSNAVHGVLNILTPDAFSAGNNRFGLTAGPHDFLQGKFSVAKSSDNQALLAYGTIARDGGYKDESGYDQQKLNLIHQYTGKNLDVKTVVAATNLNQETAGFIQGFEAFSDPALKKQNPNPEAFRDSQSLRAYSQINYRLNQDTQVTVTPYVRWTDMQFLQHFLPWKSLEENGQKSLGVQTRLVKQYQDVTFLSGIDWDFTQGELQETQADPFSPTIPAGEHYDYEVDANVLSPYAHLQWQVSNKVRLNAGARYEYTNYDYSNKLTDGSACAEGVEGCRFTRPGSQENTFNEWSFQLGGQYALSEDHRLYSQFSTGYRAPQATELYRLQAGQTITDLQAENVDSLEVGSRGQWQSLFYDLTLFTMQKDNFIFQDTQRQNISNGETSHRGIELTLKYQLPQGFYVSANATLARHRYDNDLTLSRQSIKDNEIDTAPEHLGSAQLGWQSDNRHQVELEWVHLGNYYLNPENTAEYAGHDLINLRSNWQLNNNITLSAQLINLTDSDYAERADFAFGNYRYFVGEPRSLYLSVEYQLD